MVKEGLSLQNAVAEAREKDRQVKERGVDQPALDAASTKGFGNALFEYDEDEVSQVVEDFYPPNKDVDKCAVDSSSVVSRLQMGLEPATSASK